MRLRKQSYVRLGLAIGAILLGGQQARAVDSAAVKTVFAAPPREYSSAPLWVWNDMLTEEQVVGTLRDLAGQQVKQAFVHPRPGLMTPYLSGDWFRLWKAALAEAERLDMNLWIYDENSYPSGFAGGFVPEVMPESRGRGLAFREEKAPGKPGPEVLGVYRMSGGACENVTDAARSGEKLPEGSYLVAFVQRAGNSPWHGGRSYVDLLYPGVTEKFLDITLGAYAREIGGALGKRVPGSFTDEPELTPAGGLPWTDDLPAMFEKRWGYKLTDHLPSLVRPSGDWKRVRHDYYQLLLDLFIDRWGRPYYEYCERLGLEFTGHYWEHEWPQCGLVPDNMAMAAWQQRPGIDTLMNQYQENTHAQFGNVRAVRELASVANQLGRTRTICEAYGAGGWDLRFEDMKRIGDWLFVLGINTLDEHLSYVTLRGARKRDHPQSFSYHEPWWSEYHIIASYFTRLAAALSHGEQVNEFLVLEPTTTAWMYQGDNGKLGPIGDSFFSLLMDLERAQVEYDIGCEDVMARHGSVADGRLRVGKRSYGTVVLPPLCETLNTKTIDLLERFLDQGGGASILACGEPPALVEARPSARGAALAKKAGWKLIEPAALPAAFRAASRAGGFAIRRGDVDKGILFHHRRALDDGDLLFLANTSIEHPSSGLVFSRAQGAETWCLETGKVLPCDFARTSAGIAIPFELPPSGSLLLFLSKARPPAPPEGPLPRDRTEIAPRGSVEIKRVEPNVLVLDCVDVTAGGETKKGIYFYQASAFAFQKNGMPRDPWDSAVQFRDELISKTFPPESGLEATYRFTIEGSVPPDLAIVIERPDLYTIACNGTPVTAAKNAWWLDRAFGRIEIASSAKAGENAVTIKARPFTIYHEIEPAYVLGSFALKPAAAGYTIVADRPLEIGAWNAQGHPFFATGVSYGQQFEIGSGSAPGGRYFVSLPSWYGSVAKVLVNGKRAGAIAYPPWECDVTDHVKDGANAIEVIVVGTLKNTLGPHHGNPPLGSAWPGMFQTPPAQCPPPGEKYSTVGYGLFKPFVLERRSR